MRMGSSAPALLRPQCRLGAVKSWWAEFERSCHAHVITAEGDNRWGATVSIRYPFVRTTSRRRAAARRDILVSLFLLWLWSQPLARETDPSFATGCATSIGGRSRCQGAGSPAPAVSASGRYSAVRPRIERLA